MEGARLKITLIKHLLIIKIWCEEANAYNSTGHPQRSRPQPEAEAYRHQALAAARCQQAKSLELRAATSLARLWQQQDKRDNARKPLGEVYGWFTKGIDTADAREAKALWRR